MFPYTVSRMNSRSAMRNTTACPALIETSANQLSLVEKIARATFFTKKKMTRAIKVTQISPNGAGDPVSSSGGGGGEDHLSYDPGLN